ncbi:unnamed protein product [Onchocerca ochengi]|uniref:G_PROTEIN_RECEP_F1_2 domain-containing protein n=1 Tax=Onchocerca ochengi TaxID=42157 RepID=A0A182E2U5_ONCOC|nr:unnamed protein product [Onchocerca ochengi]
MLKILSAASILLLVYAAIILVALGGNLLVCIAVFCDRILRRQQENLFLVSLAVSDLLISLLVMLFAAANDTLGYWPFGRLYCQIWICFDITCTTASILNLSAIALHRFLYISRPLVYVRKYKVKPLLTGGIGHTVFVIVQSKFWFLLNDNYDALCCTCRMYEGFRRRKICIVIAFVWLISAIIGFTQIILELAQRDEGNGERNETDGTEYDDSYPRCELRLKPFYALGSSMCSFVIPAAMMVLLYTRLYLFARKHAKIMRIQLQQTANFAVAPNAYEGIRNNANAEFYDRILAMCHCCHKSDPVVSERIKPKNTSSQLCITDQKARLTLGVIMGTFLICWLPFFIVNVIRSFLPDLISDVQFKEISISLMYPFCCTSEFDAVLSRHFENSDLKRKQFVHNFRIGYGKHGWYFRLLPG